MPDRQTLPPAERTASELDYKPASAVAVAAIIVAGLYVLIAAGITIAAIANKRPFLNYQLAYLAGLGLVLSIAARLHIRRSEGTRVGLQLANTAWWLSVLGGVAFVAYLAASIIALRQQSERIAFEWFKSLEKKEIDKAFLLTVAPLQRQSIIQNDIEKQFGAFHLPQFRNTEVVRFFRFNGDEGSVQSLGMSNWQQIDRGYRVDLSFLLTSPEGQFESNLGLFGWEGENIVGREWQVLMNDGSLVVRGRTKYGWTVELLRRDAETHAHKWMAQVNSRFYEGAALSVLPPGDWAVFLARENTKRIIAAFVPNWVLPMNPIEDTFRVLIDRGFFKLDGPEFLTNEKIAIFKQVWGIGLFYHAGQQRLQNPETAPILTIANGKIEAVLFLEVRLPGPAAQFAKARLILESDSPELLKQIEEFKSQAKQANAPITKIEPADLFLTLPPRNWRVVRFESSLDALAAAPQGTR